MDSVCTSWWGVAKGDFCNGLSHGCDPLPIAVLLNQIVFPCKDYMQFFGFVKWTRTIVTKQLQSSRDSFNKDA